MSAEFWDKLVTFLSYIITTWAVFQMGRDWEEVKAIYARKLKRATIRLRAMRAFR